MPPIPYISRQQWQAVLPKYTERLVTPVPVVVFRSTRTDPCFTTEECIQTVWNIQERHIAMGLPDIIYNFLIGGDGYIYEGRGWDTVACQYPHSQLNKMTIEVGYIGKYSFPNNVPPENMMEAAKNLTTLGVIKKALDTHFVRTDLDIQMKKTNQDSGNREEENNVEYDESFDIDEVDISMLCTECRSGNVALRTDKEPIIIHEEWPEEETDDDDEVVNEEDVYHPETDSDWTEDEAEENFTQENEHGTQMEVQNEKNSLLK